MKENCIICGVETAYDQETHIDFRTGYMEGVGQLCHKCFSQGKEISNMSIPTNLIHDYPNNTDLGEEVRRLYWEKYRNQNKRTNI